MENKAFMIIKGNNCVKTIIPKNTTKFFEILYQNLPQTNKYKCELSKLIIK